MTGATSAIGMHVAAALLQRGYSVTIAARVVDHAKAVIGRIADDAQTADIRIVPCELSSLASVRGFADTVNADGRQWSVLVAGATATLAPLRSLTDDGFEWNLGVNYLAHFALTGLLQPSAATDAKVISTTSPTAATASIKFYDLRWDHGYRPGRAYASSRLATLLHSVEHARRLSAAGSAQSAVITHPGFIQERPRLGRTAAIAERLIGHTAEAGAQSMIRALAPDIHNGAFIAPSGAGQLRGTPAITPLPDTASDRGMATRLWRVSQQLTGVTWM